MSISNMQAFAAGYLAVMENRFDQRGQGVPCGSGWISRSKKCSKEKAGQTSKEAKQKAVVKSRDRLKLKQQIKASKGQKARNISDYEKRERRGQMTLPLGETQPKSTRKVKTTKPSSPPKSQIADDAKIANMSVTEFLEGRDPKSPVGQAMVKTHRATVRRHQKNTVADYEKQMGKFMTEETVQAGIAGLGTGKGGVDMGKIAGRPILVERPRPGGKKGTNYAVGSYDRNGKLNINTMSFGSNPTQAKYNYLESMDMLSGGKNDYTRNATPKRSRSTAKPTVESTRQQLTAQRNREIKSQLDQDPTLQKAVDFYRGPKTSDRKFLQSSGLSRDEAQRAFTKVRETLGLEPGQDPRKAIRDLYGRKKRSDSFNAGYAAVMSDRPLRTRDFAAGYAAVMAS